MPVTGEGKCLRRVHLRPKIDVTATEINVTATDLHFVRSEAFSSMSQIPALGNASSWGILINCSSSTGWSTV